MKLTSRDNDTPGVIGLLSVLLVFIAMMTLILHQVTVEGRNTAGTVQPTIQDGEHEKPDTTSWEGAG